MPLPPFFGLVNVHLKYYLLDKLTCILLFKWKRHMSALKSYALTFAALMFL